MSHLPRLSFIHLFVIAEHFKSSIKMCILIILFYKSNNEKMQKRGSHSHHKYLMDLFSIQSVVYGH